MLPIQRNNDEEHVVPVQKGLRASKGARSSGAKRLATAGLSARVLEAARGAASSRSGDTTILTGTLEEAGTRDGQSDPRVDGSSYDGEGGRRGPDPSKEGGQRERRTQKTARPSTAFREAARIATPGCRFENLPLHEQPPILWR